ncbi:MAG: hypothetical protein H0V29_01965 [Thermoleophilaceae bacterium]|nr:hypothetical protein [Thermoleophilaceae bacterium]
MTLLTLALASALMVLPATSSAAIVGLGDQNASTFSDPLFKNLGVNKTRLITPYNAAQDKDQKAAVDQWMAAARGKQVMVAFNPKRTMRCPARPCSAPSAKQYAKAFKAFRKAYPKVKIYQPWNESNSKTQPTSGKRGAKKVAGYYDVIKKACKRCTVVGADIQDIGNFTGYVKDVNRFIKTKKKPKLWGFHNYTDTNRFSTKNTKKFVRAVKGKVWLTETGGIFSFTTGSGQVSLPPDEDRAARSMEHMFKIAKKFRSRIQRIYVYQWRITRPDDRFDAGVVNLDGSPRKSYDVLLKNKRQFK